MKKLFIALALLASTMSLSSCGYLGGAATGAGVGTLAAGGGYEYNAKRQEDRIKKDLDAGTINQSEYDIRKDQIKRMSLVY